MSDTIALAEEWFDSISSHFIALPCFSMLFCFPSGYAQACTFGVGGYMTSLAIVCYFVAQMIVCCAPRPNPIFEIQKPKKRYQKKKRRPTNYEESPY